jgi:GGDEF domain-containing protein
VVARIGGNSLAVLAVGCSRSGAEAVADRIRHALASEGFKTFIGIAAGRPAATLETAWRDAEISMSRSRRAARNGHGDEGAHGLIRAPVETDELTRP